MYNEEFSIEGDVLGVKLKGTFPTELINTMENAFTPLMEACKVNKCKKVLIDASELLLNFETMDLFKAGEQLASYSKEISKVAILTTKEYYSQFFEDVATNRGANVQIFINGEKARGWLHS